jgi:hypothetical protein
MIKEILDALTKELRNESNREKLGAIFEPIMSKVSFAYSIIILLLVIMIALTIYTHMWTIARLMSLEAAYTNSPSSPS